MKITNINNTNFSGLTLESQRYIGDKIWYMASHGRAKDAVKIARLFRYFQREKNHTVDIIGYNGSPKRALLVYKVSDFDNNPIKVICSHKYEESEPGYVLTNLTTIKNAISKKIPTTKKFTAAEQDFIDKFERPNDYTYNADGLYNALKSLERYYKYGKRA